MIRSTTFARLRRLVLPAALSSALVMPSVPVGAGPPGFDAQTGFDHIQPSDQLQTPVIVSGEVEGADDDTDVVVFAEPSQERFEAMEPGDHYTMIPVARDSGSRFEARVDPDVDLRRFSSRHGWIDFVVFAVDGDALATWSFSRELLDGALVPTPTAESADDGHPTVALDLHALADSDTKPPAGSGVSIPPTSCTLLRTDRARRVLVGQMYHVNRGARSRFSYSTSSESTLGVAFSQSGQFGSWEVAGTSTRSTTSRTWYPRSSGLMKRYFDTFYDYGRYRCRVGGVHEYYRYRPISWAWGGDWRSLSTAPRARHCTARFRAGMDIEQRTTDAITWRNGVDVLSMIGINLSTQTGYTNEAGVTVHFVADGLRACGTHGRPGDGSGEAPRQLVLRR